MTKLPVYEDPRRIYILLRRDGRFWRAELPGLKSGWESHRGYARTVVREARSAVPNRAGGAVWIKVEEGTELNRRQLLALLEANNGSKRLDLSYTIMAYIDLSPSRLATEALKYSQRHGGAAPPWLYWTRGIDLSESNLEGADLNSANLEGANLESASLEGALLGWARLPRANLQFANLERASLVGAQLRGAGLYHANASVADMSGADIEGADFTNCDLRHANLYSVKTARRARWWGAELDHTLITRMSLGDAVGEELGAHSIRAPVSYTAAKEAYLALKNNFSGIGRYEDASWAHVKEQQMEKMALYWEHHWRLIRPLKWRRVRFLTRGRYLRRTRFGLWCILRHRPFIAFIRWANSWLYEILAGYGERPLRPILLSAFLATLFFPALYWGTGALSGHGPAFNSLSTADIDWAGLRDSFVYSLTTFGTLSFSELQPDGTIASIISATEAFIGVLLFALFVLTLGNRMSR